MVNGEWLTVNELLQKIGILLRMSIFCCIFAANFNYDFFRNDFFRNSALYGKSV